MPDDLEIDIDDIQRRMDGAIASLRTELSLIHISEPTRPY